MTPIPAGGRSLDQAMKCLLSTSGRTGTPQAPGRTPDRDSRRASGTTHLLGPLRCPGAETLPVRGATPRTPRGLPSAPPICAPPCVMPEACQRAPSSEAPAREAMQ
jgi:hypothetical protein